MDNSPIQKALAWNLESFKNLWIFIDNNKLRNRLPNSDLGFSRAGANCISLASLNLRMYRMGFFEVPRSFPMYFTPYSEKQLQALNSCILSPLVYLSPIYTRGIPDRSIGYHLEWQERPGVWLSSFIDAGIFFDLSGNISSNFEDALLFVQENHTGLL